MTPDKDDTMTALPAPKQPEQDAYLAAVSELLLCLATPAYLTSQSVDVLLDALPWPDLRENLRVGLAEAGLVMGPGR